MRPVTPQDMDALAGQMERAARVLRTRGREAVRRAKDWATPLKSSQGFGPKNETARPTENAALNHDPIADELDLLSVDAGQAFDAVTSLESRVLRITTDAVIENQRAGIGHCGECERYMDGTKDQRLRLGLCEPCYRRTQRKEAKAG